jgi:hypothetical protein
MSLHFIGVKHLGKFFEVDEGLFGRAAHIPSPDISSLISSPDIA